MTQIGAAVRLSGGTVFARLQLRQPIVFDLVGGQPAH
jgi:hypothetical protein